MKISEKPTEHILVRAYTGSEWDNCDCALVSVGTIEDIHSRWRNLNVEAGALEGSYPGFLGIKVLTSTVEFLRIKGVDDRWTEIATAEEIPTQPGWLFVEIEEDDKELYRKPEQKIEAPYMEFYGEDNIAWFGYSEVGDEFFTETISLADIINAINSYQC
jgi:hypothetical protein